MTTARELVQDPRGSDECQEDWGREDDEWLEEYGEDPEHAYVMARGSERRKRSKRKPPMKRGQKGGGGGEGGSKIGGNRRDKENKAGLPADRVQGADPPITWHAFAFSLTVVMKRRHASSL